MLSDFIDCANVGMVERRCSSRFASEAFKSGLILRPFIGQELQGDETAQFGILGLENNSHSAAADFIQDAVVRNCSAEHVLANLTWTVKTSQRKRIYRKQEKAWPQGCARKWLQENLRVAVFQLKKLRLQQERPK